VSVKHVQIQIISNHNILDTSHSGYQRWQIHLMMTIHKDNTHCTTMEAEVREKRTPKKNMV